MKRSICIRLEADAQQIMDCREAVQVLGNSFEELSNVLNLTGNPVRLKILYLLHQEGRLCVCDLSDILEMNVSAISQHLRKLRDRSLIYPKKEGQTIFYAITKDKLTILQPFFELIAQTKIVSEKV
jgi:DNA-binding transcriptional ArsR family regulator